MLSQGRALLDYNDEYGNFMRLIRKLVCSHMCIIKLLMCRGKTGAP